jgi:hypothetical protein
MKSIMWSTQRHFKGDTREKKERETNESALSYCLVLSFLFVLRDVASTLHVSQAVL